MKKWLLIIPIVVLTSWFSATDSDEPRGSCGEILAIAKDPEKVAYLKSWMENKFTDPNFFVGIKETPLIFLEERPNEVNGIDVDWKYLGISEELGSLIFYPRIFKLNSFEDFSKISSVGFGIGYRIRVIIKRSGAPDFGYDIPKELEPNLIPVTEDVIVICAP